MKELTKMNGKVKALLIVLGFLMMLQAVPMIKPAAATDEFNYPGINGTPPHVESLDVDYTYHTLPNWVYYPDTDPDDYVDDSRWEIEGYFHYGLVTQTEFDQELHLNGPTKYYYFPGSPSYVESEDLTFQKIGLYCPVFLLERELWYTHEFNLDVADSESFTFSIEGGFSRKLASDLITIGASGSYSTTTSETRTQSWGITLDERFGTAESLTVYIYMEFLRVNGTVTYDGNQVREYDAILLERMDLDDFQYYADAPERPEIDNQLFFDRDGDGPDYRTAMGDFRQYSYKETKEVSWGLDFSFELEGDVWGFETTAGFECSTETSMKMTHRFESDWYGDPYMTDKGLPTSVHGFWISVGSFFSVNLKINHSAAYCPTEPTLDVPTELDVYESGDFSATSTDPLGRDLYYVFHWGDGEKTVTDFHPSGQKVTVSHTYTEPMHRMIIVEANNYYGEGNDALQSLDVLSIRPDVPAVPTGPTIGLQDFAYSFDFVTEDDHNQRVCYEVDWGDGTTEITDFYASGELVTASHAWAGSIAGINYDVSVRAKNEINGLWSDFSEPTRILVQRSVPGVPSIGGDDSLYVDEAGNFWVQAVEPSGLQMRYTFHFSDGYSWTSDWVSSGTLVSHSHAFDAPGTKGFWADAKNSHTVTSTCDPIFISVRENVAPYTPSAPSGRSSGYEGITYSFTVSTTDVDGDNIRYEIAWGDGTTTLSDYYSSGATATLQHAWNEGSASGTSYDVKVRAQDSEGHWSDWSSAAQIVIGYSTPNVPSIDGPDSLRVGTSGSFWAQSVDPAGVQIRYKFYWSDGATWTSSWVSSGTSVTASHAFSSTGTKSFWVEVTNEYGQKSTADPELFSVYNSAPYRPSRPSGPSSGYTGNYYTFSFITSDPEGHNIRYQIDWGDGSTTTTGYYSSGTTIYRSHKWRTSVYGGMYYYVKVRAQDSFGAWSSWSSSKSILIKPTYGGGPIIMSQPPTLDAPVNADSTQLSTNTLVMNTPVYSSDSYNVEFELRAILGLR